MSDSVWSLQRNDLDGAIDFARRRGDKLTPGEAAVLLQLQDDPTELMSRLPDPGRRTSKP